MARRGKAWRGMARQDKGYFVAESRKRFSGA